jgi:hypothetical protein
LTPDYGTVLQWSTGAFSSSIYISESSVVTVQVQDGQGCIVTSLPVSFTKNIPQQATITGAQVFCPGDSVLLNVNSGPSYLWSNSATSQSIYIKTSIVLTVTVTDDNGCTSVSQPFSVTAQKAPTVNISSNAGHLCAGQSMQLTASGALTYVWSTGATTAVISTNVGGNYTVTGTGVNGCKGVSAPYFADIGGPAAQVSPAGPSVLCTGKKMTLTATAPSAVSYQWYKGNSILGGATASSYIAGSGGNYKVKVTDASGCTSFSPVTVITIATAPAASFATTNQFDVCQDSMVTLTGNSGTLFTYQWQRNNISLPAETSQVINTVNKGSYRVIVSSEYGCTRTSSALSIPIANPTASIVVTGPTSICTGDSTLLTANSGINYTYQWQRNGANISGATNPNFYAKVNGTYRVRVFNAMGCSATSANKAISVSNCGGGREAMPEAKEETPVIGFTLYPVPFSTTLYIIPDEETDETLKYHVIDLSGRVIQQGKIDPSDKQIEMSSVIAPGLYILSLEGTFGKRSYKIEKSDH